MTCVFERGSGMLKSGVSLRMRVPGGIEDMEKQPRPSPGEGSMV